MAMVRKLFRRFLSTNRGKVLFLSGLAFTTVFVIAVVSDEVSTTANDEFNETEIEDLIFEYVNEERTGNGMNGFLREERISEKARSHAENMAEEDFYNHTSPEGVTQRERYQFCSSGENIHKTEVNELLEKKNGELFDLETEREVAERIVEVWMNSKPHREKGIYGQWSQAGVGIEITEEGDVYAVLGFCR